MPQPVESEVTPLTVEDAPNIKCEVCSEDISADKLVTLTSNRFNTFLKEYHIYSICPVCYDRGRHLFKEDLEVFLHWLEEHDNRAADVPLSTSRQLLRRGFDLSASLIEDDPDRYQQIMDKYATRVEDMLVWLMDRYNLDPSAMISEFERHKVKML